MSLQVFLRRCRPCCVRGLRDKGIMHELSQRLIRELAGARGRRLFCGGGRWVPGEAWTEEIQGEAGDHKGGGLEFPGGERFAEDEGGAE